MYSKRLAKSQRQAIKQIRRDSVKFSADISVTKSLTLAKRSADIKMGK